MVIRSEWLALFKIINRKRLAVDVGKLEAHLSYRFKKKSILIAALAHKSYLRSKLPKEVHSSNERLEFLGDSVLGLVVSEFLYQKHPQKTEGELTKMKAVLVNEVTLSRRAKDFGLGEFLLLSPEEERSGGRQRESILADACEAGGLTVPELSKPTTASLSAFLPPAASVKNPVDLIASATPDHYTEAITTLLASKEVDALIVLYMSVAVGDAAGIANGILRGISTARQTGGPAIPIYICWMAEGDLERTFQAAGETVPTFPLPEHPAVVLGKACRYEAWRTQPLGMIPDFDDMDFGTAQAICAKALSQEGPGWLTVEDTRDLLAAAKLPVAQGGVAKTSDQAAALACGIGFPVAVKLASHQILHKTEMGGVHLNLADEQAVRAAFESIRARLAQDNKLDAMEGVLVQPMLSGGTEVMVGVTHDPLFGPLIAFGLGGIHVEILGDVRFRITPLTDRDAAQLVREIKGYRLLQGYRGHPAADVEAIEEVLLRLSRLVEEIPEISELDLNPIFALPPGQGCRIVDARIREERSTP